MDSERIAAAMRQPAILTLVWICALLMLAGTFTKMPAQWHRRDFSNYYESAWALRHGIDPYATVLTPIGRLLQTALNDLKVSRLRWVLKYLTNRSERDGCLELSQRTDLMNVDPKAATNYLAVAKSDQRVLTNCMQRLAQPREERFDGLALHQLRLLSQAKTGNPEAKEFERIACDQSMPWPTRGWAWAALARADGTKASRLMEAAREEAEPNVRRAIVATLKRHACLRRCRRFLRNEARICPANRYTVEWVKKAA